MCGIAGIFGKSWKPSQLEAMVAVQTHRGPDADGTYINDQQTAGLGHNRLSIIDLSDAGRQPMRDATGRRWIAFNGEVYNYLELRRELDEYAYRSRTDTEVVLTAYQQWGEQCLDHFVGMFALLLWDEKDQRLFAARDRFGVKPLYYHHSPDGRLLVASEIKALHAAGVPARPNETAWATYLSTGVYDHSEQTFWEGINSLPAGHKLVWQDGVLRIDRWYDVADRVGEQFDDRSPESVQEEYLSLLKESVRLRFRADVPVGVNLSGGLDSSTLLGLVHAAQGKDSDVKSFTFVTGDDRYDELPWVQQMLAQTRHPSIVCKLSADEIPTLAESVQRSQDEPFGGFPTLAYAKLFAMARDEEVIVLLDGQGMDEQWAGYDYYTKAIGGNGVSLDSIGTVQQVRQRATRPECLTPDFLRKAQKFTPPQPLPDSLRNLQYRDIRHTKIPRALRFNDRVSMRSSVELREPFLDHRLFELALRQPVERKIVNGTRKWLLRRVAAQLLPDGVVEAPKRALQTPQREWLAGVLAPWADAWIETAIAAYGGMWLDADAVRQQWREYQGGDCDNSFYVWQWINLGLCTSIRRN